MLKFVLKHHERGYLLTVGRRRGTEEYIGIYADSPNAPAEINEACLFDTAEIAIAFADHYGLDSSQHDVESGEIGELQQGEN